MCSQTRATGSNSKARNRLAAASSLLIEDDSGGGSSSVTIQRTWYLPPATSRPTRPTRTASRFNTASAMATKLIARTALRSVRIASKRMDTMPTAPTPCGVPVSYRVVNKRFRRTVAVIVRAPPRRHTAIIPSRPLSIACLSIGSLTLLAKEREYDLGSCGTSLTAAIPTNWFQRERERDERRRVRWEMSSFRVWVQLHVYRKISAASASRCHSVNARWVKERWANSLLGE